MRPWLSQHRLAIAQVLRRTLRNKLSALVMFAVLGVALCLPAILYVAVDNLHRLAGTLRTEPQISVFLKLDQPDVAVKQFGEQLHKRDDISRVQYLDRNTAWQTMQKDSAIAAGLDKNPLPDVYVVFPKSADPADIERLQQVLQQLPGVELAQLDADWVKRLYAILELGKKAILALVVLLGFALAAIIGNTIRLQIATQREEIEVSKLIGATNRFIRRPFLYAGMLYGLGGGLAALALLGLVIAWFNRAVADIAKLYASDFHLALPGGCVLLVIVCSAVVLGWLSAWFAVGRALRKIDAAY